MYEKKRFDDFLERTLKATGYAITAAGLAGLIYGYHEIKSNEIKPVANCDTLYHSLDCVNNISVENTSENGASIFAIGVITMTMIGPGLILQSGYNRRRIEDYSRFASNQAFTRMSIESGEILLDGRPLPKPRKEII